MPTAFQPTAIDACPNYPNAVLGLTDSAEPAPFKAVAQLVARLLDAPIALVSFVEPDKDRQYFSARHGFSEPMSAIRQTPLTHSFCKHVVEGNKPLVLADAREHPELKDNLAIEALGIVAYCGVPFYGPSGAPAGALCAIDTRPHAWSDGDVETLTVLSEQITNEIALRSALRMAEARKAELSEQLAFKGRATALRESLLAAFGAPGMPLEKRLHSANGFTARSLGMEGAAFYRFDGSFVASYAVKGAEFGPTQRAEVARLCLMTMRDERILALRDTKRTGMAAGSSEIGSFIGTTVLSDDLILGVLCFWSASSRERGWDDEQLGVLSLVSLLTGTYLALDVELDRARRKDARFVDMMDRARRSGTR